MANSDDPFGNREQRQKARTTLVGEHTAIAVRREERAMRRLAAAAGFSEQENHRQAIERSGILVTESVVIPATSSQPRVRAATWG